LAIDYTAGRFDGRAPVLATVQCFGLSTWYVLYCYTIKNIQPQVFSCPCSVHLIHQKYSIVVQSSVAIIDPRTGRSMWKKEGWTLQNPITPENFAEMAMDFCSRNSFDRPPQAPAAPRSGGVPGGPAAAAAAVRKRPMHEMSEEDQIQAAMRASLASSNGVDINDDSDGDHDKMGQAKSDDDDDDVEFLGTGPSASASGGGGGLDSKPAAAASTENGGAKTESTSPTSAFIQELLQVEVGDEPTPTTAPTGGVARLQLRMPDGKRVVRQFAGSNPVKVIYAYVAVCHTH
jgi:UBX domain-containing protein 7